jgi:hypothetical protein
MLLPAIELAPFAPLNDAPVRARNHLRIHNINLVRAEILNSN